MTATLLRRVLAAEVRLPFSKHKAPASKLSLEAQAALAELDMLFPTENNGLPLDMMRAAAEDVVNVLKPMCDGIAIVGSIRRCHPRPNDIDILIMQKSGMDDIVLGLIEKMADDESKIYKRINSHNNYQYEFHIGNIQVHILLSNYSCWGEDVLQFTGSREFLKVIDRRCERRGYQYSSGRRVKKTKEGNCYYGPEYDPVFAGKSEEYILEALGLSDYKDPSTRNL